MTPQECVGVRGFRAGGHTYRRGDTYNALAPENREEAQLLRAHGLIAPRDEAEKGGPCRGRDDNQLPPIRGV
jgi:hypothetical protein